MSKIVIICGPTATGKTDLAIKLAQNFNAEIVSADSMLVYKYMNIGTAKPSKKIQEKVKHFCMDLVFPDEDFTAKDFQENADKAINEIEGKGKNTIVVGGTGFYIRALVNGLFEIKGEEEKLKEIREKLQKQAENGDIFKKLEEIDPEIAKKLSPNDIYRITRALEVYYLTGKKMSELQEKHNFSEKRYDALKISLFDDRQKIYEKINARVHQMLEQGLLDEIKFLLEKGYKKDLKPLQTFGYRFFIDYLEGKTKLEDAAEMTKMETRRFCKRQFTWFRSEPEINWFNPEKDYDNIINKIKDFYEKG